MQKPHLREGEMLVSASISALSRPASKDPWAAEKMDGADSAGIWYGVAGLKKAAAAPKNTANKRARIPCFIMVKRAREG